MTMDWQKITPALQRKLDPKNVKEPPRGKYGQYIEGWHAIAEANEIFGFGGWSYRVDSLTEANRELVWLETPRGEKYEQWRVSHVCMVTVTVGDVSRQDVGTGQGQGKPNALGDAIDSSAKEAVTDALKRALRSFGNRFGLALYDKTKANVGVDDDIAAPAAEPQQPAAQKPAKLSDQAKADGPLPTPAEQAIAWLNDAATFEVLRQRWRSLGEKKPDLVIVPQVEDAYKARADRLDPFPGEEVAA